MRDYIIVAVILAAAPFCLFRSYFGLLMWTWVAYFNPHRFGWGVAYNFPVAMLIGGATLAGLPFAKDTNRRIFTVQTILLLLMWCWFCVTYFHAAHDPVLMEHAEAAQTELLRISKILLMIFVMVWLVSSREKLRYLFLVTAFSFGFFAIKGALFTWQTSGQFRVYGPPDSFIEDNNAFGLALNMMLPMFYFLAREEKDRWLRFFMHASFFCAIVAVLLTYSRGALLGLTAVLTTLALRSRQKVLAIFFVIAVAAAVLTFAPAKWMDRMGNFAHGNLDQSAELRLNAWQFAFELAKNYPVTGGGLKTFSYDLYQRYTPQLEFAGAHSIYFQTLGEHGFVGLVLFLLLLGSSFYSLRTVRRRARSISPTHWIISYSYILEIGLLAFITSGAFLELANFDLFYQVIGCVALLKILFWKEVMLESAAPFEVTLRPEQVELVEA
jgi:probable O-glycosylation ligase (exosortase A-associated)